MRTSSACAKEWLTKSRSVLRLDTSGARSVAGLSEEDQLCGKGALHPVNPPSFSEFGLKHSV